MHASINPHLHQAVEVFRELGWDNAPIAQAPTLPLGTPEQQKLALQGLHTGKWFYTEEVEENCWATVNAPGVDTAKLALFAVRLGVGPVRAAEIVDGDDLDTIAAVLESRGRGFVEKFCAAWWSIDHPPLYPRDAFHLCERFGIAPTTHTGFLREWLDETPAEDHRFLEQAIRPEIVSHPNTQALQHKLATHPDGVRLVFEILDIAPKAKPWIDLLNQHFSPTPSTLYSFYPQIVALAAKAETSVIEKLALPILPLLTPDQREEIVIPCVHVKNQRVLLKALRAIKGARVDVTHLCEHPNPHIAALALEMTGEYTPDIYPWVPAPPLWEPEPVGGGVEKLDAPTYPDGSISVADLATRITDDVELADLIPALTRLNLEPAGHRDLPPLLERYLNDPIREPGLCLDGNTWVPAPITYPDWLVDAATGEYEYPSYHNLLRPTLDNMERIAAATKPLEPPVAINFLGLLSRPKRQKVYEQVYLAWSRGLLLPGVPDWVYYNWTTELGDVKPLIAPFTQLAEDGLLSLIWPLLDALLLWPTQHDPILAALKKFAHSARGHECPGVHALAEKGNEKAQEILAIVAGE
ncbi:hypothetical protein CMUST_09960 [Corynebacterium mustelae]|uniref:Uncharacterized protein n=1 Tax=Corynebacterium mustelae TaxID=571915 RepID=A0A0G3H3B5_9CORY|nr:hypothetical protein [Corynebacterium mustelae]AKK06308.1 hypothetical protein CMUST_09960 [Corynebacterium mustelae]